MITLFGAPGAGKTEQGKLLALKHGWEWVSYRDLLMELHDKDISYALENCLFIDDDKATELMQDTLNRLKRSTPRFASDLIDGRTREIILDGFPADYRQVKWLIDNGEIKNLKGAIVLRVPRGELWRRLVARKRVDDTRAAIERRQDAYERNITGMIKTLTKNGVLVREVNGCNSPQDVLERIDDVLADWGMVPKKQYERISESSHKAPNWLQ